MIIPALVDFKETKGLCFLYHSPETKAVVNRCVERLLWRVAVSTPSKLCDFLIYNGGNPGGVMGRILTRLMRIFAMNWKLLCGESVHERTESASPLFFVAMSM